MSDKGAVGLLSSFLRHRRISVVKPYVKGRVLDVGCGTGPLTDIVQHELYLGIDNNNNVLQQASILHPKYNFQDKLPLVKQKFNTIVVLAVIEHISNPIDFLISLANRLGNSNEDSIICTTPHPSMGWVHTVGAAVGIFSKHASEQHEELLNKQRMIEIAEKCNLNVTFYKRFLCGANQLIILQRLKTVD